MGATCPHHILSRLHPPPPPAEYTARHHLPLPARRLEIELGRHQSADAELVEGCQRSHRVDPFGWALEIDVEDSVELLTNRVLGQLYGATVGASRRSSLDDASLSRNVGAFRDREVETRPAFALA